MPANDWKPTSRPRACWHWLCEKHAPSIPRPEGLGIFSDSRVDCDDASRYDPCAMDDKDITLRTILDHMRGLEDRINKRFDGIDMRFNAVDARIDLLGRNLTRQINAIDKRLDEIEIAKLPQRVERIEQHLQLAQA